MNKLLYSFTTSNKREWGQVIIQSLSYFNGIFKKNNNNSKANQTCELGPGMAPIAFPLADPSPPLADPFASPCSKFGKKVISNPTEEI